ncbi:hypothetical protein Tco_0716986 [Tanacetum coccineum]
MEYSRSNLSWLRRGVVFNFLTPSLDRSRRRRFRLVTPSPYSVSTILQEIWCRLCFGFAPLSLDYVPASPDSEPEEDDSSDKDLAETVESLQTQNALTSFVQPPFIRLSPLAASPSSPPPLVLPSSSRKRSKSPSPPLPPETVTLRARVETLEQHDMVTRDSLRIARDRITLLQLRAVAAKQQATDLQDS